MKKTKKPKKQADPRLIFNHGVRFLGTDQFLRDSTPPASSLAMTIVPATLVLSAFASELFLKCLLVMENQHVVPTHRLDVLYKRLSNKLKHRLEEMWEADCRPKLMSFGASLNLPTDLSGALDKCGNAFEKLRYHYEDPESVVYYIGDFAWILGRVILEIKPEWTPLELPPIQSRSQAR